MKLLTRILIVSALFQISSPFCFGQTQDYSNDTKSLDSTVKALYDVISGSKGEKRNWDRFRHLFAPGARLIPTFKSGKAIKSVTWSVEDYVSKSGPYLESQGFFEREIGRKVDEYGSIAQVMSSYESKTNKEDKKPIERGINSIQLTFDGERWWVQTILWAGEQTAGPIPKKYLRTDKV